MYVLRIKGFKYHAKFGPRGAVVRDLRFLPAGELENWFHNTWQDSAAQNPDPPFFCFLRVDEQSYGFPSVTQRNAANIG